MKQHVHVSKPQVWCDACKKHTDLTLEGECENCFRQLTIGTLRRAHPQDTLSAQALYEGGYVE